MARSINRLNARSVATYKEAGLHADGDGLYLNVRRSGTKSWTLIYRFAGRRRELGLGALSIVSLAEARQRASQARKNVSKGIDPGERSSAGEGTGPTFGTVSTQLVDSLEAGWKSPKHRQQWRNTLATYAAGIWKKPIAQVDTDDLLEILSPIWATKAETADRVRGRVERVLDAARVRGLRQGDNPARWRGQLSVLLPPRMAKRQLRHHPAMPFGDVGAFMVKLAARDASSARALEFTILTAARTSEALNARWREIDTENGLWTIPAARMKAGKEHRVPLSDRTIDILQGLGRDPSPDGYLFRGGRVGMPLSNMGMEMLLRRMGEDRYTVHGFRSAFRDWAGEMTDTPREIAEAALAHSVGSAVERAYRRGDSLDKRRELMARWATYLNVNAQTLAEQAIEGR